jgi:hypothetical protein
MVNYFHSNPELTSFINCSRIEILKCSELENPTFYALVYFIYFSRNGVLLADALAKSGKRLNKTVSAQCVQKTLFPRINVFF